MVTKNPSTLWRDIDDTADYEERLERVRQATLSGRARLEALRREERELEAAHSSYIHHPGSQPGAGRTVSRLRFVGVLLVALDIPVQYLLNSAALVGVAAWKVLGSSIALPIGLAAAIQHLGEPLLYDGDRPARSIRIAKVLAAVALIVTLAGASVFLFARQASGEVAGSIVALTTTSLWAVAEALPLTAGFVGMWAHMLAKPLLDNARLHAVSEEIASWTRFLERVAKEEEALAEGTDKVRSDYMERLEPIRLTSALVLLVTFASLMGNSIQAQSSRSCALFVDRSRSVDSTHRVAAVRLVVEALPRLTSEYRCAQLIVGRFAGEGEFAPRVLLHVPEKFEARACDSVSRPAPRGAQAVLVNVQGFRDHFRRTALEACVREENVRHAALDGAWRLFSDEVRTLLTERPSEPASRTDILGLLESLRATEVCAIFLITDGIETSRNELRRLTGPGMPHILLFIVPAMPRYGGGEAALVAAAEWKRAGARTLPYTTLIGYAGERP